MTDQLERDDAPDDIAELPRLLRNAAVMFPCIVVTMPSVQALRLARRIVARPEVLRVEVQRTPGWWERAGWYAILAVSAHDLLEPAARSFAGWLQ